MHPLSGTRWTLKHYTVALFRVLNRPEFSGRHDVRAEKFGRLCAKSGSHTVGLQENSSKKINNNNNNLIYIAPACQMTSEALADSSSRATECPTEK